MKLLIISATIMASFLCGCSYFLDGKKDVNIAEDIIDDVVKEETGTELNLGPEHQAKGVTGTTQVTVAESPGATGAA